MAMPPSPDLMKNVAFRVHLLTSASHIANFQGCPRRSSQALPPA